MSGRSKRHASPPPPSSAEAVPPPYWLLCAIVVLLAVLLLAAFSPSISDSDFWWHLRTGQYIAQTHSLPYPDPFAYTTATAGTAYPGEELVRRFNLTHEWLFQLVLYLIYAAGGFAGVVAFRAVTLSAVCCVVGFISYRRTSGFYRSLLTALACATVAAPFATDRPFGISFLLLAIVIAILDARRFLWLLPPLFLVWANLHGGFFIGWVPLAAYSAGAIYSQFFGKPRDKPGGKPEPGNLAVWLASALSIAFSGLNPNFFNALRVVFLYRQSVLQSRVWEWQHTRLWPVTPFTVVFIGTAAVLIAAHRKVRFSDWLLFAAFGTASLLAVRNTMLIGILGPILAATYIPWRPKLPAAAHWAAGALLVLGSGAELAQGRAFQFRADTWKYPAGAATFLEEHGIRGRLFNDYTDGGYLIWRLWPLQRVFIDGRALSDQLYLDFANIATNIGNAPGRNAPDLLRRYGIEVIALSGFEYQAGTLYLIVPALSSPGQTEWKLVYVDDVTSVFMKSPPPGVVPIHLPYALAGVERQCRYRIAHDPATPLCAKTLAFQFLQLNDLPRAREWFAFYLDHKTSEDAEAQAAYQSLLSRRRR